jgi:small subunit ribosomal protein S8e
MVLLALRSNFSCVCENSGARKVPIRMKRKYELGRPPAMTKLGPKRVHEIRTMGCVLFCTCG